MKTLFKTLILTLALAAQAQADTLLMQIRKPTGSIVEKTVTVTNDTLIAFNSSGNPILKSYATLKGNLALTKSDVGLGNVDNTSDANKPVSTATQAALDARVTKADRQTYNAGGLAGLFATLTEGKISTSVQFIGDSTGANDTYGYPVLVGTDLGTRFPAYTIKTTRWFYTAGTPEYGPVTTIQTGTGGGERRIEFPGPGDAAATWMIENGVFPQPTGDFSIITKVRFDSWPSSSVPLFAKWVSGQAGKLSLSFVFRSDRKMQLYYSIDGSTQKDAFVNTATTFSLGAVVYLRCDYDADNGASGRTITMKVSTDGVTYSTVGSPYVDSSGTGGVFTATPSDEQWELGILNGSGAIYSSVITNGINGVIVSPRLIDAWNYRSYGNSYLAGPPELWIINSCVSGWSINDFSGSSSGTSGYLSPNSRWLPKFNQQAVFVSLMLNSPGMEGQPLWDKFNIIRGTIRSELGDGPRIIYLTANPKFAGMPPGTTTSLSPFGMQVNSLSRMRANLMGYASGKGDGVIDSFRAFTDYPGYPSAARADLMGDDIHPNAAGQALIKTSIINAILQGQP